MQSVLQPGDLILVNLARNDPSRLRNRVVAAYLPNERGATVKVLREDESKRFWILHPYNPEHADRVVSKKEEGFQVAAVEVMFANGE